MQGLAVELLEEIYTLSCTDGGSTGCSLSLVSKRIRETSRAARFHSISLTSGTGQQFAKFLQSFDKERAAAATERGRIPTVRHLCISVADGEDVRGDWCSWPTYVNKQRDVAAEVKNEGEHKRYLTDFIAFMQLVSPGLYSLSLVQWQGWQKYTMLPEITCSGFPLLEELTITAFDPFIPGGADCCSPFYPRLTRLHFGSIFGDGVLKLEDGTRAPHITHLRLSNLGSSGLRSMKEFIGKIRSHYY